MSVTVVIPHFGDDDLLGQCLLSIGDTDRVVWDGNLENHGFAGNCNRAARQAEGTTLVFLNNDCTVHPGWLEPLVAALDHHPIAGSLLLYPDGTTQHAGIRLTRHNGRIHAANDVTRTRSGEVAAVTGACLAIRASTFWQLDGFDEEFVNGYEDVDLCLRARDLTDQQCWLATESVVTHLESQAPGRFDHAQHNIDRLNRKWG